MAFCHHIHYGTSSRHNMLHVPGPVDSRPATARGPHAAEPLLPHPRVRRWGSSARRAQCLRGGQTTPTAVGSKASPAIGPPIARRGSLRHRSARGLPCDRSRRFRVLPTSAAAPVLLRDALVTAGSCALALLPFFAPYFRVEHTL